MKAIPVAYRVGATYYIELANVVYYTNTPELFNTSFSINGHE